MNIILLSGGSGKRLWPLSNDIRSKQFIKILKRPDGSFESMVQRMFRGIKEADPSGRILIATSKSQVSEICNQIGPDVPLSIEPCRKDTFAAIALATARLHDVAHLEGDDTVVVCPVDPLVENDYFRALVELSDLAKERQTNVVLMGIEPTYASSKYGYIVPENKNHVSPVLSFKEKPDEASAQSLIDRGALWNGGIFAFRVDYVLKKAADFFGFSDYSELLAHFESLQKISFDYAVVEKEMKLRVVRFSGLWKDLGTWNTLSETIGSQLFGNVIDTNTNRNVTVINELDVPILPVGLQDVIISASPEGILVSDKAKSSYIKPYVDSIEQKTMFAEKSWGSFRVIDAEINSLTIKITLTEGHGMHYHYHNHRTEVWTVVEGTGYAIINGLRKEVKAGDTIVLPVGIPHTIFANTLLKIIETQIGKDISVQDKIKLDL
jgi:mannose-1-phosphate guanylyltransferase